MCFRQAYKQKQITKVKWINGEANPINAIIKGKPYTAFTRFINTN